MLKKLRHKKTAKKIWIVLAVLILPAFVLWGSGSLTRSRQEVVFSGQIAGKKIPQLEFQESLAAVRNQALIQFGDKFSDVERKINLQSQAWDRLILLKETQARKIKVSDAKVISAIQNYPFFQAKGGFDKRIYGQMLAYVFRTQARAFEEEIRQNLMIAELFKEVTGNINLSDKEIRDEYRKTNEELSIYYIAGLPADFSKDIPFTDEDLRGYFVKNSLEFKQPLSFNLEYVELPLEEKVKKLYSRLLKKQPFERIAKDNGLTLKETGLFSENGPIPGIGWSPEVINLITRAKPGQYLAPLYIDKSYYILKLKERKEPYIPEFESTKGGVKEAFIKEKTRLVAKEKIENCLKTLQEFYQTNPKSVDFNKTAKIFGLKSGGTESFKYNSYIEGVGASDKFWATALRLKEGEFSGIIEMPTGFYIIAVKSIVPFGEEKFKSEKSEFSQKILAQRKQEYFIKFIAELKKQAQRN
jgi:parvulin-like peptidyl-prolyl isomerase